MLRLFYRSAYVGYTATPFANIFIPVEKDELFPRDFIINLPAPGNYVGPQQVFGFEPLTDETVLDDTLPIVCRVDDAGDFMPEKEREAPLPNAIPDSMKRAIRCFFLTCAIRRLRGQADVHNSMLIHVTRFTARQKRIVDLVDDVTNYYRRGLDQNDPIILALMQQTFEQDSTDYLSFTTTSQRILDSPLRALDPAIRVHAWETVLPHLAPAAARIRIKEINGTSGDILDYHNEKAGLSVIAIGGDKLSRGLTLSGLSVSYFLRPSKMYDTLMQMGRWFGYRPGYPDLCRLFTTAELNQWFCHITKASEELRGEFDYMHSIRATPDAYAVKVNTHDAGLQITAANKMRKAVDMRFSFAGRLVETYLFDIRPDVVAGNLATARSLVDDLGPSSYKKAENFIWINVTPNAVTGFLQGFQVARNLYRANAQIVAAFIRTQVKNGELINWTVALISRQKPDPDRTTNYTINGQPVMVGNLTRKAEDKNNGPTEYYLRKSHIISPEHEFLDLSPAEYDEAMRLTRAKRKIENKVGEPDYPNGEIVRNDIRPKERGLLLLYTLDPGAAGLPAHSPAIIGYAISFPGSKSGATISYAVHEQLVEYLESQDTVENDPDADED